MAIELTGIPREAEIYAGKPKRGPLDALAQKLDGCAKKPATRSYQMSKLLEL
jgi:hypothetical protein